MTLDSLLYHTCEWLKGTGPHSDIVISSRVRLARNLKLIPFPHWATKEQTQEVLQRAKEAVSVIPLLKKTHLFKMRDLDNVDKQFLIERHLMSHEHAARSNHKALLVSEEEVLSVMINEEDHLRIQVMRSGFDLIEAWEIINKIDNALAAKLDFAFLPEWGYLTACPTNTGTGMRASVMLHLPALVMSRQINKVLEAVAKLGFTTRGLYGEGTQAAGNFFQISNQVALGHTEEEIIDNLKGLLRQVIEQEDNSRKILLEQHRAMLQDRVWRSLGTLKNAHIISSQETRELLSLVRLGIDVKIITDLDRSLVNELFILTQPAHLQKIAARKLSPQERDTKRAQLIREKLGAEGKNPPG